jgi:hypothetical protein
LKPIGLHFWLVNRETTGADAGIRTPDLLFTKQLLCQLSYVGETRQLWRWRSLRAAGKL